MQRQVGIVTYCLAGVQGRPHLRIHTLFCLADSKHGVPLSLQPLPCAYPMGWG